MVECAKKGMVLQSARQGLPWTTGRWVCASWNHFCTVRLQCWIRKLDGWVVSSQKKRGVAKMLERAAPQQQEGVLELYSVGWLDCTLGAGMYVPSSGVQEFSSCMSGRLWHRSAWGSHDAGARRHLLVLW